MLDIKYIRENSELVRHAIKVKRINLDLDLLLELDKEAIELRKTIEAKQTDSNVNSKKMELLRAVKTVLASIGSNAVAGQKLKSFLDKNDSDALKSLAETWQATEYNDLDIVQVDIIRNGKDISEELKLLLPKLRDADEKLNSFLLKVPQVPLPEVPIGISDEDNVERYTVGSPRAFDFALLDHVALLEKRGWAEFERVGKISGTRSYMLRGELAVLEMALHLWAMNFLAARGFTPLSASSLVRPETLTATGHFPGGEDQVYRLEDSNLMLAGTAEVPVNFLHSGEILALESLPLCYAAYSGAFRSEAGSAGRDVRGIMRVHEFKKTEQYVICTPESSSEWFERLLGNAEAMLQALELPYRVLEVCTGDMGAGKLRMNDLECWIPSEGRYRETHSCSNLGDWQARRTGLRYRDSEGKVQTAYTLNNTGIATPRLLVAFVENHQQADGRVYLPETLRPLMGGLEFI